MDHYDVRNLADGERADAIQFTEELRAVGRGDVNRFDRCEARLHQKFYFALVTEAGDYAAVAGGVQAGR